MEENIFVTYLGGPTVILEIGGLRIMTDPTLDPIGETFNIAGKPAYWKTEGPAIAEIGHIDFVLLSHDQHGDNLDNAGRAFLADVPMTFTTKPSAGKVDGNVTGLSPFDKVKLNENVSITATPARHGPPGTAKIPGGENGFPLERAET